MDALHLLSAGHEQRDPAIENRDFDYIVSEDEFQMIILRLAAIGTDTPVDLTLQSLAPSFSQVCPSFRGG